jgi:hypothetical protein
LYGATKNENRRDRKELGAMTVAMWTLDKRWHVKYEKASEVETKESPIMIGMKSQKIERNFDKIGLLGNVKASSTKTGIGSVKG